MKYTLIIVMALFSLITNGQNNNLNMEKPRTELENAKKQYDKALREGNSPLLIKSLLQQLAAQKQIDRDSIYPMINNIEEYIKTTNNVVEQSILHSILADLYFAFDVTYMSRNQSAPITGYVPKNIKEWTGNIFIAKVFEHAFKAVENKEALQKIDKNTYKDIIIESEVSKSLNQSLYDILITRSIFTLKLYNGFDVNRYYSQKKLEPDKSLLPAKEYVKLDIQVPENQYELGIAKLYQLLLAHAIETYNENALIVYDLDRLNFFNNNSNSDLYSTRLEEIINNYPNNPYIIEAIINYIDLNNRFYPGQDNNELNIQKALNLGESALKKFPNYFRINALKNKISYIKEPALSFNGEKNVYPGKELQLNVQYRNLSKVTFNIYRIKTDNISYLKDPRNATRTKVLTKKFDLNNSLLYKDTVLNIPVNEVGLYEIEAEADGLTTDNQKVSFTSSRLSNLTRKVDNNTFEFLVCDIFSSKPVQGAEVSIYDRKYNFLTKGTTDKLGIARIKETNQAAYYIVTHNEDKYNTANYIYNSNYSTRSADTEVINFFTDRAIYRAGQTIYLKGIAWQSANEKTNLIPNKEYNIRLFDSRNKEISSKKFRTNEYGSFSGTFIIPENILSGEIILQSDFGTYSLTVTDYKRPNLEITFNPVEGEYRLGDKIKVTGKAASYSGVNMDNSKVNYTITENTYSIRTTNPPFTVGSTYTDDKGEFLIDFQTENKTSNILFARYPVLTYTITATITTPNGETQESTYSLNVTNRSYNINIQISDIIDKTQKNSIYITANNNNLQPLKKQLKYTISKLATLKDLDENYDYDNLPIERKILEGQVNTNSGEESTLSPDYSNWESGMYVIEVEGNDRGEIIRQKSLFQLYSLEDKKPPFPTYNWFKEVKNRVNVGENAEIIIGTSAKDVYMLFEIQDKYKIVERKQLILSEENRLISIPYLNSYGESIQVNITFFKDGKYFSNTTNIYKKQVDKNLKIITNTFRDKLKPGEEEEWSLTIKDAEGKGKLSELLISMYDASLDVLRKNYWSFNPESRNYYYFLNWNQGRGGINQYLRSKSLNLPYPEFIYDQFELYGLNRRDYRDLSNILIRGRASLDMGIVDQIAIEDVSDVVITGYQPMKKESRMAGSGEEMNYAMDDSAATETSPVRDNFAETAFFYPQLMTDKNGNIIVKFKVPDATTTWNILGLAHSKDLYYGQLQRTIITSKELMVQTNLPRFVRTNDKVNLQALISNLTDKTLEGEVYLELFNPETNEVIQKINNKFNTSSQRNETVNFTFKVPANNQLLGCRVVAVTPTHTDGEQHILPIVPNETLVTKTLSIFTNKKGSQTYNIDIPKTGNILRYTLEFTSNPVWYGVMAIPSINAVQTENVTYITANYHVSAVARMIAISNPGIAKTIKDWANNPNDENLKSQLEKNQELKNIILQLTPWVNDATSQTERIKMLSELLDENRQDYINKQAIEKLVELQNADGGWGWFKEYNSSVFMTLNVLEAMARLVDIGVDSGNTEKNMQISALNYLDKEIENTFSVNKKGGYNELLYLYVRSSYRDIPLTNVLTAHKYYMSDFENRWLELGLYEKAIAAMTFHRYGFTDLSKRIINSLREYSTTTEDMGMFWANNRTTYYRNSAIQIHTAIMNAFQEIDPNKEEIDNMKQWLLRQKQTQDWGNVPSTVDALHALLLTGTDWLGESENMTIKLGNKDITSEIQDGALGYIKYTVDGDKIKNTKSTNVTINKNTESPTWGGLYLQYFDKLENITFNASGISVKKELYLMTGENDRTYQQPISDKQLKVGDRVNVRIVVETNQDLEYVYLKDLRAGCFEPTQQLPGNERSSNIYYFKEITDVASNFFIENLPKGVHTFEYQVWVSQSGEYQDGIATIQCIYAPEFSANSDAINIVVKN